MILYYDRSWRRSVFLFPSSQFFAVVGGYVLPRFSVSFPKTGFLLIPKRPEPPIEIFMGRTEVVYFADGFGNLVKKNIKNLCCYAAKKDGQEDFAGEGVDDIGDKGQV